MAPPNSGVAVVVVTVVLVVDVATVLLPPNIDGLALVGVMVNDPNVTEPPSAAAFENRLSPVEVVVVFAPNIDGASVVLALTSSGDVVAEVESAPKLRPVEALRISPSPAPEKTEVVVVAAGALVEAVEVAADIAPLRNENTDGAVVVAVLVSAAETVLVGAAAEPNIGPADVVLGGEEITVGDAVMTDWGAKLKTDWAAVEEVVVVTGAEEVILSGDPAVVTEVVVDRQNAGVITIPLAIEEGLEVVVGTVLANNEVCGVLKTNGEGITGAAAALVVCTDVTENSGCCSPIDKPPRFKVLCKAGWLA